MASTEKVFRTCSQCSKSACVIQNGHYLCLLHHCASKGVLLKGTKIYDENELQNQSTFVERLWRDAVSDVIMRMYDIQKSEEELLKNDPLEILTMNVLPVPDYSTSKRSIKRPISTGSSTRAGKQLPKLNEEKKNVESITENSSSHHTMTTTENPKCENCDSRDTRTVYSAPGGNLNVSKNETWGSKSAHSVMINFECKSCGHAVISYE